MFSIKLAGHIFTIDNQFPDVEAMCKDYLCREHGVLIRTTPEQLQRESTPPHRWRDGYLETLAVYRKICEYLIKKDILLFHCSALALDGKAYLFTAPSGTGKSTHARLWRERFGDRVVTVNDDKPLLEFTQDGVIVYGTPYGGKDHLQTNTSAPVAGIVILSQGKTNTIQRISSSEALPELIRQSHRPDDPVSLLRYLELVEKLSHLPVFRLSCTISQEAVDVAYQALQGE